MQQGYANEEHLLFLDNEKYENKLLLTARFSLRVIELYYVQ